MLSSAQTPVWTYPSLTETMCTACECSAAVPSNGVLSSSIIEYSTMYNSALEGGGAQRKNPGHDHGQDHAQGQDGKILVAKFLASCFLAPRSWPRS